MLKHAIFMIIFSVLVMMFQSQVGYVLHYMLVAHDQVADILGSIFSNAPAGRMIQETIALVIIPLIIGVIVAFIYWLIKRREVPHIIGAVWFFWTVLIVMILAQPMRAVAGS